MPNGYPTLNERLEDFEKRLKRVETTMLTITDKTAFARLVMEAFGSVKLEGKLVDLDNG